jgi:hypothetical protein
MPGDLFDFGFDDPAPSEVKKPAPAPAPPPPEPAKIEPCARRPWSGGYRCRVGGGDACFSDNNGGSWFCRIHAPRGFFPADREESRRA